jgi:hypothetical protein
VSQAAAAAAAAAREEEEATLSEWTGADDDLTDYKPPAFGGGDDEPPRGRRYHSAAQFTGPRSFFDQFFDDQLIARIVTNTNAELALRRRTSAAPAIADDATAADIRALFGTLLLMSTARMDRLKRYWDKTYGWARVMSLWSRDRFFAVFNALSVHGGDDPSDPDTDRMWAVRPFVNELNERFAAALVPGRDLCVDETMIAFRGDHPSIQMMKNKPIRIGFKCFTITNHFGYVLHQTLYEGSTGDSSKDDGLTERVVLQLVAPFSGGGAAAGGLPGPWRIVTMDSFYTGVPLFKKLKEGGTLAVGTLRTNRKFYPKELTTIKLKPYARTAQHTLHCSSSSALRAHCALAPTATNAAIAPPIVH